MKIHMLVALIILAVLSTACQSAAPTGQVETQVAATIVAGQTATAAVEQAVQRILTASAPPPLTETPTPVPPTPTPTPVSYAPIKTSAGTVVITKVEIVSEDAFGNKAAPGYQILLISFESADGTAIDGGDFFEARKGVYITTDDGSQSESYMGGLVEGKLVVGFTPPTAAHKFVLHWFDNPPIELELGQ